MKSTYKQAVAMERRTLWKSLVSVPRQLYQLITTVFGLRGLLILLLFGMIIILLYYAPVKEEPPILTKLQSGQIAEITKTEIIIHDGSGRVLYPTGAY